MYDYYWMNPHCSPQPPSSSQNESKEALQLTPADQPEKTSGHSGQTKLFLNLYLYLYLHLYFSKLIMNSALQLPTADQPEKTSGHSGQPSYSKPVDGGRGAPRPRDHIVTSFKWTSSHRLQ